MCGLFREFVNNGGASYKTKEMLREMADISL